MLRPKLIYLARRNPDLSPEGFVARWRQHGALGMSMPRWRNIWRYAHCDVMPDTGATGGMAAGYDGVGLIWHRSPTTRRAHREDLGSQGVMEADERATFAELVRNFCALYEEQILVDAGVAAPVKLFRFHRAARDVTDERLREEIAPLAADLVLQDGEVAALLRRYVHDYRMSPEGADWGLDYGWIEEMWFDDPAKARAAHRALAVNGRLRRLIEQATVRCESVITNDVLLYQLGDGA